MIHRTDAAQSVFKRRSVMARPQLSSCFAHRLARALVCSALLLAGIVVAVPSSADAKTLRGNDRPNKLQGTGGKDVLLGRGGGDRLYGKGGNDRLSGDAGRDRLYGGAGSDALSGGAGNDRLSGGPGRDKIQGGPGNDVISGGGGKDLISCGGGKDRVTGIGSGRVSNDCESKPVTKQPDSGEPVAPSGPVGGSGAGGKPAPGGSGGGGGGGTISSARTYTGTLSLTVHWRDICGNDLGIHNSQETVSAIVGPPLASTGAGEETNPIHLFLQGFGSGTGPDALWIASALRFGTSPEVVLQFWTLQFDGANITGTLTDDHQAEAASGSNAVLSEKELIDCMHQFPSTSWTWPISEGASVSGTITSQTLTLRFSGNVQGNTREFVADLTASRAS
jgi:Ca2+-binding RTX toxin-like protein